MITKIKINKKNKCVPKNFEIELKNLTIITGENNVGKTTFVKSVYSNKDISFYENEREISKDDIELVFFPAENISPSDSELKTTNKTSNLLNNLTLLFERLDVEFKLENSENINSQIQELFNKIQENMESFFNHKDFKIDVELQQFLDRKTVIMSLIEKIIFEELGEKRKLDEIGQGIQRLVIVSVLKSYSDILKEKIF